MPTALAETTASQPTPTDTEGEIHRAGLATAANRIACALVNAVVCALGAGATAYIATLIYGVIQLQGQAAREALRLEPGVLLDISHLPAAKIDWSAYGLWAAVPAALAAGITTFALTARRRDRVPAPRAACQAPRSLRERFPRLSALQRTQPNDPRLSHVFRLADRLEALSAERHDAFVNRYLGELEEMQRQLDSLAPDRDSRPVDAAFTRFEQALVSTNALLESRRERELFSRTSPIEVTARVIADQLPVRGTTRRHDGSGAWRS